MRLAAVTNEANPEERAALAVQAFRQSQFVEEVGPATRLEIEVRAATTRHVVTVGQGLRWTEGGVTSPAERLWALAVRRVNRHPILNRARRTHDNLISG